MSFFTENRKKREEETTNDSFFKRNKSKGDQFSELQRTDEIKVGEFTPEREKAAERLRGIGSVAGVPLTSRRPTDFETQTARNILRERGETAREEQRKRDETTFLGADTQRILRERRPVLEAQREQKKIESAERKRQRGIAEDRMKAIQEELIPLTRKGSDATPEEIQRIRDLNREFTEQQTTARPFGLGVAEGTLPLRVLEAGAEQAFDVKPSFFQRARQTPEFKAGKATGTVARNLAQYSVINNFLGGLGAGTKLGKLLGGSAKARFAATQGVDLLADTIVQTPIEAIEAIQEDKTLDEFAKDFAINRGIDVLMNAAIGVAGEGIKALKKADIDKLKKVAKDFPDKFKQSFDKLGANQKGFIIDAGIVPKDAPQQIADITSPTLRQQSDSFFNRNNQRALAERQALPETLAEIPQRVEINPRNVSQNVLNDANAFRSKVDRVPTAKTTTIKQKFNDVIDKIDRKFIDDTQPFRKVESQILGDVQSAEASLSKQARLFKGAPEAANEIVRTELKPAIKMAENAGFDYRDLGDYALAVHARDVNDAGLKSGFSDAEIDSVIQKFGTPEMEVARQELTKVSDRMLDMLREDGLLSADQLSALKNKWTNYMPLFRSFDDNKVSFGKGLSESFSNVTAPIKTLKGSDRAVLDPIESMVGNIYKTVNATRRNRVGLQLAKLAEVDVDNNFIRKLADNETVGRKNVVNVTIDGVKTPYEVQPDLFEAFNNLDKESSNTLIKILSKPASLLRAGATLTPEFALRNPMRDIQNAFIVSKSGFNPITDFAAGLGSTIKKGELYQQWLREGGGYGNLLSMDRQAHKEALERVINQPVKDKIVNVFSPKSWIDVLRSVSDITESATKVGEFRAALRSGATPAEAAFRSRDLMDFARAGSAIRPANRVVAFLNANIQGKSKMIRSIKENPAKVSAKLVTSMALPSLGAYAATYKLGNQEQIKRIEDAPDWMKNTFWLVPVPGTDVVARIPKPFDASAVANGTERFMDYVIRNDKDAFNKFIEQTVKDQSIPVMLTGIMPWLEGISNYSFFRQAPIIPQREQTINREDQFDSRTSEIAKLLASGASELLGQQSNLSSPRVMDYILRTSAGGLGDTTLDSVDWLLDKVGVTEKPPAPALDPTQLPGIKGFTINPASSGQSLNDFYELRNELQRKKGSARLTGEELKEQDAETLKRLDEVAKRFSEISQQLRDINESFDLTPEQKRTQIDNLIQLRNNIAIEIMKEVRQ